MLADQMIERIETLHKVGIVHRDIKPGNFLMGRAENAHFVYIIDFGLASKFLTDDGEHIKYNDNASFHGTHRYASANSHERIEQSRRDDLEALGYVLIYFAKGGLPWQNLNIQRRKKRKKIGEIKRNTTIRELTKGLPRAFQTYFDYARNLEFDEIPNYGYLRDVFASCMEQHGYEHDYVYDWYPDTFKPRDKTESSSSSAAPHYAGPVVHYSLPESQGELPQSYSPKVPRNSATRRSHLVARRTGVKKAPKRKSREKRVSTDHNVDDRELAPPPKKLRRRSYNLRARRNVSPA